MPDLRISYTNGGTRGRYNAQTRLDSCRIQLPSLLILPYTAATLCSSKEQGEPQHRAPRIFIRPWPLLAWLLPPLERSCASTPLPRRSRTHHRRRWPSRVCLALSTHDVECDGSVGQRGERWWPCGVLGEPVVQIVGARLEGGGWAKGPQCLCTGPSCFDLELVRVWHVLWESAKGIHVRLRRWSVVPAHALAR